MSRLHLLSWVVWLWVLLQGGEWIPGLNPLNHSSWWTTCARLSRRSLTCSASGWERAEEGKEKSFLSLTRSVDLSSFRWTSSFSQPCPCCWTWGCIIVTSVVGWTRWPASCNGIAARSRSTSTHSALILSWDCSGARYSRYPTHLQLMWWLDTSATAYVVCVTCGRLNLNSELMYLIFSRTSNGCDFN